MNMIEANAGGTVCLRGIQVPLESDVGREFIIACARNWEQLLTDADLCERFGLSLEQWQASGNNRALVRAVQLEHERRVRKGLVAQELSAREFIQAPRILASIMETATNNPRHRIDAAQALRQASLGIDSENKAQGQVFTINLNFGTAKVHKEITLGPHSPEQETLTIDGLPTPRETGLTVKGDDHEREW
jgi:hypothetical protein